MLSTRRQLGLSSLIILLFIAFQQHEVNAIHHNFMGRYFKGQLHKDYMFDKIHGIDTSRERLDANYDDTVCVTDPSEKITVAYFDQPLDHFAKEPEKSGKWQQHYQVNDKFFKKSDSPVVFLMIGGEGPMSNKWVCYEDYTYMHAAKKYNAKVIQLEHRFFGHNKGLKDLSVASLQYLTTEQAMADINAFILGYNKAQKWTAPKWVAFGGSYPGTIAGLLRLKYPGITQGNVASSAPLKPVVDFYQYASVMETAIKDTDQKCYDAVKVAFKSLYDNIVTSAGRAKLNTQFNLDPPFDEKNIKLEDLNTVNLAIFDAFQGIIQYTYDGANGLLQNGTGVHLNVAYLCKLMTNPTIKDPLDRLYNVFELTTEPGTPIVSSYAKSIESMKSEKIDGDGASMRGWMWLSCNEFGWLQSTSHSDLFGNVVPISYYLQMCADLFNNALDGTQIYQHVKDTETRYGSNDNYNGTNVFLPNGLYDPWSALGVQDNKAVQKTRESQHLITHFTPQAAHCADMYGYYPGEPKGLAETRQIFDKELEYYLKLDSVFKKNDGNKGKAKNGSSTVLITSLMFPLVLAYFWVFK